MVRTCDVQTVVANWVPMWTSVKTHGYTQQVGKDISLIRVGSVPTVKPDVNQRSSNASRLTNEIRTGRY